MSKSTKLILYALIPLLLGASYIFRSALFTDDSQPEPTITAQRGGPGAGGPLRVNGVLVRTEPFSEQINITGNIVASEEVMLRPEVSGRITELAIQEGRPVRAGDLLVKVNDATLRAELLRARLRLELAELREGRQKSLLENRAISEEDYDVALNEVNTLKAEIDLIQARIDLTEIRAPFNGIIGLRNVSEGSYITPSNVIASLQDYYRVRIDFSIPERHAGRVAPGDRIRFTGLGSQSTYTGEIIAIEPRIDPTTRTLQLRAVAENPSLDIIPGAFVEIQLQLREIPAASFIPSQALIPDLGGATVYVVRNGQASQVRVETGIRSETRVQITDGLVPGDTVITTGILQMRQDLPVRVTQLD